MSNTQKRRLMVAAALITPIVLAGCAIGGGNDVQIACPSVQIAVPSDQIGHRRDDGALSFIARIDELSSSCRPGEETVEVDIAFTMEAERGPALKNDELRLVYYLATVNPNREIIDKQFLNIEMSFELDQPRSVLREALTLQLPAASEAGGANYNLYLGFQPDRQPAGNTG